MRAARVLGICLLLVTVTFGALVGAGMVAHDRSLVVRLTKVPVAAGTGGAVQVRVEVRNRIAAFVPVPGFGSSPAWRLERRTGAGSWTPLVPDHPRAIAWLAPYQVSVDRTSIDEPSVLRARVRSGTHGETEHVSNVLAVAPDDFDQPPRTGR